MKQLTRSAVIDSPASIAKVVAWFTPERSTKSVYNGSELNYPLTNIFATNINYSTWTARLFSWCISGKAVFSATYLKWVSFWLKNHIFNIFFSDTSKKLWFLLFKWDEFLRNFSNNLKKIFLNTFWDSPSVYSIVTYWKICFLNFFIEKRNYLLLFYRDVRWYWFGMTSMQPELRLQTNRVRSDKGEWSPSSENCFWVWSLVDVSKSNRLFW